MSLFLKIYTDKKVSNLKWLYPNKGDVCKVNSAQVLRYDIIGDWDVYLV